MECKKGLMHDRFASNECQECGNTPCTCKKPDSDFCPDCHSKPCACDDNIWANTDKVTNQKEALKTTKKASG